MKNNPYKFLAILGFSFFAIVGFLSFRGIYLDECNYIYNDGTVHHPLTSFFILAFVVLIVGCVVLELITAPIIKRRKYKKSIFR
jgi:hypothetical protein